jgi:hypothetical protein
MFNISRVRILSITPWEWGDFHSYPSIQRWKFHLTPRFRENSSKILVQTVIYRNRYITVPLIKMNRKMKIAFVTIALVLMIAAIPIQLSAQTSRQSNAFTQNKKPSVYGIRQQLAELNQTSASQLSASSAGFALSGSSGLRAQAHTVAPQSSGSGTNLIFNLDPSSLEQNEESVAVNPANPNVVIEGTNDYRHRLDAAFKGVGTGFHVSTNGGTSVANDGTLFPANPYVPSSNFDGAGDPVIDFSATGVAYMGSLGFYAGLNPIPTGHAGDNGVFVFSAASPYTSWTQHTAYSDPNSANRVDDKDWIAVDKRTSGTAAGAIYAVWARFGEGSSPFGGGGSPIRLVASFDGGATWILLPTPVSATNLCPVNGSNATDPCPDNQFSDVRVGADGTVYVTWVNFDTPDISELIFERSVTITCTTGPACFTVNPAHVVSTVASPIFETRDFRNARIGGLADQRQRVDTIPHLAVDTSSSKTSGRLYVVWEDLSKGAYYNLGSIGLFSFLGTGCNPASSALNCLGRGSDVQLAFSDNAGTSWSTPARVDTKKAGPVHDAFNTGIAVDPSSGLVSVTWYDSRFDPLNNQVAVMLRSGQPSKGGINWQGKEQNILTSLGGKNGDEDQRQESIDLSYDIYRQTVGNFAGDYIQIAAFQGHVYVAWTDTRPIKNGFHQEDNMLAVLSVSDENGQQSS